MHRPFFIEEDFTIPDDGLDAGGVGNDRMPQVAPPDGRDAAHKHSVTICRMIFSKVSMRFKESTTWPKLKLVVLSFAASSGF